jgi:fatty-acyl-CoA synthase
MKISGAPAALSASQVEGVAAEFLTAACIGDALQAAAQRWPHREALVSPGQNLRLTWSELEQVVGELAAGLLASGLRPGDRVALWAMNSAEWVIAQLATASAGLVLVTINPAYRVAEFTHAMQAAGCAAIIVGPAYKSSDFAGMLGEAEPALLAGGATQVLTDLRLAMQFGVPQLTGFAAWENILALGRTADPAIVQSAVLSLDDLSPVNIQFTSGTTGLPKGVVLSHRNILQNGWFTGAALGLTERDRLCLPVPLYHCFGMVTGVLACLAHGTALVLPGAAFGAEQTLKALADERCTALYGVPTMYLAMLSSPDFAAHDLSSLRTGIMAGSLCKAELMQDVMTRMHMPELAICYGMTEAPVSFQTSPLMRLDQRLDTVGAVQPNIEAKIVSDLGATVAPGVPGEICVRGYNTMIGYWNDPEATAATKDSEGWVHTGDLGTIDRDGFLRIVGRIKEMVIRGGENLYPKEIEDFLRQHPDVVEVHAFGVADAIYGEELCAWIRTTEPNLLNDSAERDFCAERLSHNKVPKHIRFVDAYPITITGKVQKHVMRAQMEHLLAG